MGLEWTPPGLPGIDVSAEEYLAEYGRQRRQWLADKAGFDTVTDEEGVTSLEERPKVEKGRGVTVVEPKRRIEPSQLPLSGRKVHKAATELGLETSCWLIVTDVDEVLYLSDSDEGNAKEYRAGDVRYPQKFERRYVVEARLADQPFGFQAFFVGEGLEGQTGPFEIARIRDPYGILVENWVDYTVDKRTAEERGWSEERRIQEGMAMNRRINDGSTRVETIRLFKVGGDFTGWLDEYLSVKGLATITPKRKPKEEKTEERESAILSGGEWNG